MDKNELLARSRAEKRDEGEAYVADRGRRAGVVGFCAVTVVILTFNFIMDQNNYVPLAMFWAYLAAEGWGKYRASRARSHLWVVVFGGAGALCWLACHILTVVKAAA